MAFLTTVLHKFISTKPQSSDASLVRPSNWNDEHDVEMTAAEGTLLGAVAGGGGAVTDIPMGTGLSISGGAIVALGSMPIGVMLDFGGGSPPPGWLYCDGAEILRADYPDLFTVIGEIFGAGDGLTTFKVPDLRGRVTAGRDGMGPAANAGRVTTAGSGISGDIMGAAGGLQDHILLVNELPAHDHDGETSNAGKHTHLLANVETPATAAPALASSSYITQSNDSSGNNSYKLNGTATAPTLGLTSEAAEHLHTIPLQGDDDPHNNMQPTMMVSKIIYTGVI